MNQPLISVGTSGGEYSKGIDTMHLSKQESLLDWSGYLYAGISLLYCVCPFPIKGKERIIYTLFARDCTNALKHVFRCLPKEGEAETVHEVVPEPVPETVYAIAELPAIP